MKVVQLSCATLVAAQDPSFLGAFGLGGNFEAPPILRDIMGQASGQASAGQGGPQDLVESLRKRRKEKFKTKNKEEQKALEKQIQTEKEAAEPSSLMEVEHRPRRKPRSKKRLRGAHHSLKVNAEDSSKRSKHAKQRRREHESAKPKAVPKEAALPIEKQEKVVAHEDSQAQPLKCDNLVLLELHIGDSYKVVQHCSGTRVNDLIRLYRNVLPEITEVRVLDEDQVEVGKDLDLASLAASTDTGAKGKLPLLLWIVEDTWDPMPANNNP